ncbi:MAG: prohibitin family protein [Clostridiales bacterium]|nr:prohibitin family protein [Clostridiales bacterium]
MGIKFILSAVLMLFTVLSVVAAVKTRGIQRKMMLACAAICLILLAAVPASLVFISTGEVGVVKVFGEAKHSIGPGMHWRFWLSDTVEVYDIKTREIPLHFEAYSKDAQIVSGQLAVQYQVKADNVMEINRQYGSVAVLEQKLQAVILERAKSVFADRGAMLIVETRSVLSGEIEKRIVPVVDQYYVNLTMVALSDIAFNAAFENAVEQKMIAEQEKLRADYDKERAIIKAEEQLAVAEREAKAVIAKAQGDAEALRIMQEAWSALSAEVKEAMLRQTFYEKWDGVLPEVMSGDTLDLIIGR